MHPFNILPNIGLFLHNVCVECHRHILKKLTAADRLTDLGGQVARIGRERKKTICLGWLPFTEDRQPILPFTCFHVYSLDSQYLPTDREPIFPFRCLD